ncbi:MAG TPA: YfhO family protein, partial [Bacillota bacterium]|nr:YfhO family protein [Bacillota bacterium]
MTKHFNRIFNPTPDDERNDSMLYYRRTFWLALLTGFLLFIPFLIESKGVFLYFGDYNAQQIPFYEHCVQMVHDGNFGWDWLTDLGSNYIGSYSYYLLGSPYFWFMCLFPATWAPYLMAPMFIAKFVTAAVFSFAYLRRFVKNQHYAVIGALLYSFSGFGIYNIFFNQFHEVIAFFPLLLIGMEELIQNDRKGYFALAVAINAMINYFMFAGQVVFCIIYFLIRCSSKTFRIKLKSFFFLAVEAVIGALMSMVLFLPAALAIIDNPRMGSSYSGWGMLYYRSGGEFYTNRYLSIIESFFFPPDIPSRKNFIVDNNARWASLTAYLPLFSMTGVIAYIAKRKKAWFSWLIIVLIVMALVPLGNSTFFLLNSSYYARWYYMLILVMTGATVIALDRKFSFKPGLIVCGAVCTAFTVALGLTWKANEDDASVFTLGQPAFIDRFWVYVIIAFVSLAAVYVLTKYFRGKRYFNRIITY